jgi:hypothetical protein
LKDAATVLGSHLKTPIGITRKIAVGIAETFAGVAGGHLPGRVPVSQFLANVVSIGHVIAAADVKVESESGHRQ